MKTPRRRSARSLMLAVACLLGGCAWDTPQTTLVPKSDFARAILHIYGITTWVTLAIALGVLTTLALVLLRFRERPGAPLPAQVRGHTLLELSWTIAPALVLLVLAIPTIHIIFRTQGPAPRGALEITVRGWQWWWEFRYPTLEVSAANELHIPAGRAVVLTLEGPDVIHSFWVPQLGGKRDVVPGRSGQLTLTADTPGEYRGQCAEFCGTSHANMGLRVFVDTPDQFDRWIAAQRAPAPEPTGDAITGQAVFASHACVGCHTIRGVSAGALGPDLTHFASRATLAAGMLPITFETVTAWVKDPLAIKPGSKMPALGLSDAEARAVAAYLLGLK